MSQVKLFLSFSSTDWQFTRQLMGRMTALRLTVWDYSDEEGELPVGKNIERSLKERLRNSELFIPLISPRAFISRYCMSEVTYALELHSDKRLQIWPITSSKCPNSAKDWPAPFQELATMIYHRIDFTKESVEVVLKRLCDDLGQHYMPPISSDRRLPFLERFVKELEFKRPIFQNRENAIYRRLLKAQQDFDHSIAEGNFRLALVQINFIIVTLEYEFPHDRLYYPYIVKAVCEISCGRLAEAQETLHESLKYPMPDGNVFGALGYIKNRQGAYYDAMVYYQKAYQISPDDTAAKYNELLNALFCNEPLNGVESIFNKMETNTTLTSDDAVKVRHLRAQILSVEGRLREAYAIYDDLIECGHVSSELLIHFSDLLISMQAPDTALNLLMRFRERFIESADFSHYFASLCFRMNLKSEAIELFSALTVKHPRNRKYRVYLAQAMWLAGEHDKSKGIASVLFDRNLFRLPSTPEDFYYDGFANWILGRTELADYDFARSGLPVKQHYQHVL